MGFLAGLNITRLNEEHCTVSMKYSYLTKNPFQSIYFACLSMGAELSTGVLAMLSTISHKPSISMLVVNLQSEFTKKAVGKITFTCNEGKKLADTIKKCTETGEGKTVTIESIAKDETGDIVAKFCFTWSFKQKKK